jgi:hypothetical protein
MRLSPFSGFRDPKPNQPSNSPAPGNPTRKIFSSASFRRKRVDRLLVVKGPFMLALYKTPPASSATRPCNLIRSIS